MCRKLTGTVKSSSNNEEHGTYPRKKFTILKEISHYLNGWVEMWVSISCLCDDNLEKIFTLRRKEVGIFVLSTKMSKTLWQILFSISAQKRGKDQKSVIFVYYGYSFDKIPTILLFKISWQLLKLLEGKKGFSSVFGK